MRIINISPLLVKSKREIADDLLRLKEECGVTDVAFMLPLAPEGINPSMDKADYLISLFLEMRNEIKNSGLKVGILMQSLIGHGTHTDTRYQRIIGADGSSSNCMCPLDKEFKEYVHSVSAKVAATNPDFLIVDDDFRIFHGKYGCFCPLHLEAFNVLSGKNYDRASLMKVLECEDAESRRIGWQWDDFLLSGLLDLARDVRAGIDSVSPKIPCGFCGCYDGIGEVRFIAPITKALAGANPPFARINNAWYMGNDARGLLDRVYWTAMQIEALKEIPEILSESDTYPHNQYCTPARALNGQIIMSLLHGTTGAKLWVTRTNDYEPGSGEAYREKLKGNIALYRELRKLVPYVKWRGPALPLPKHPVSPWNPAVYWKQRTQNWVNAVAGRMGIPCEVGGGDENSVIMLTGQDVPFFSDEEITSFLGKGLLLDGAAAECLCSRGFSEYLGVVVDTPDWTPSFERMTDNHLNGTAVGKKIPLNSLMRGSSKRLHVKADGVKILSNIYTLPWYFSPDEELRCPGSTLFENSLGGRVAIFIPPLSFPSYMNETRRAQLISVIDWLWREPQMAVVLSDVDIYARRGIVSAKKGGGELLCIFNLSMETLPELKIRASNVSDISLLSGNGHWKKMKWARTDENVVTVRTKVETMEPLILRLR